MRTTITLTPEADALVRQVMRERDLTFKDAVNAAIVDGLAPAGSGEEFRTPTADLGRAQVSLDRAIQLAGDLEDHELMRRRSLDA